MNQKILKFGIAGAVLNLLFAVLLWGLGPERFNSAWALMPILLSILAGALCAGELRKEQGNVLSFQQAIRAVFGTYALAYALYFFPYIAIGRLDSAILENTMARAELTLTQSDSTLTPAQVQERLKPEREMGLGRAMGNGFKVLGIFLILGFLLCLLVAAILRREHA